MKKSRVGGKTEIGNVGRNVKVGSSFPTGGRLLGVSAGLASAGKASASKASAAPSFRTAKAHRPSTSFGVIWIPRRKTNKYRKDKVYNSHHDDRSYARSPSMYNYMSGDSSNNETLLKKKENESFLTPEPSGHSSLAAASTGAAVSASGLPFDQVGTSPDEKYELLKQDKQDDQEAAGDADSNERVSHTDSKPLTDKDKEVKTEKEKLGDNVDSVYLRSPPKARSTTATPEQEEDCGIKCLYYTLQCCDCVLM